MQLKKLHTLWNQITEHGGGQSILLLFIDGNMSNNYFMKVYKMVVP